jgi:ATP-dependent RNA helicase DeaD
MEKQGFKNLKLSKEIQKAIMDMGFEEATPIQGQSIPPMLEGKDVVGQAQTGTGKTAAFGIAALEMIDQHNRSIQAVILCPTRELAIQVAEELKKLSKYKKGIEVLPVYGGQPIDRQIRALRMGVHIIIGTPGRVMDHLDRRTLKMDGVQMIILDEADEMLDMGFREDIETIMKKIPKQRQTILFSATMSRPILDLTKKYLNNPQMIKLAHKEMTVPKVEQFYYEVKQQVKPDVLARLIDLNDLKLSLVFCNTKRRVDELVENLRTRGYLADGLHGDLQQRQRDTVMAKFRRKEIEILVATDVAARGIDVGDIEAVFNYDIPPDDEYYVHRIGRTARAGKTGAAYSFVTGREVYRIRQIQQFTKSKIIAQKVPSISDVEEIKTNLLLEKVKGIVDAGHLGEYSNLVEKLNKEDYPSLDIAAALLKILMGENGKEETHKNKENFSPGIERIERKKRR